jgi:hypothetical protein
VEKLTLLKKSEIQPFLIVLESDKLLDIEAFLQESTTLIIDIPQIEEIITRILLEKYNY